MVTPLNSLSVKLCNAIKIKNIPPPQGTPFAKAHFNGGGRVALFLWLLRFLRSRDYFTWQCCCSKVSVAARKTYEVVKQIYRGPGLTATTSQSSFFVPLNHLHPLPPSPLLPGIAILLQHHPSGIDILGSLNTIKGFAK